MMHCGQMGFQMKWWWIKETIYRDGLPSNDRVIVTAHAGVLTAPTH